MYIIQKLNIMINSRRVITNNFTIHSDDIFNKENDNTHSFLMDMIMILFVSYFFGNFLEGFEEYLIRHRNNNNNDHDDAYDIFDATMLMDFD